MGYFDPVIVTIGRRHEKRYLILLTDMSVKAVHLEIANTVNTDILGISRFIKRTGCPQEILSDNGINFHAADTELRTATKNLKSEDISTYLTRKEIKCSFLLTDKMCEVRIAPGMIPQRGGSTNID